MYGEELELCYRIAKKGFSIIYFEEATAIHKHGGSIVNKNWGHKQRYLSTALLYYKVHGIGGFALYHSLFIVNTFTNFLVMWWIDKTYRKDFLLIQRFYFSNFDNYFLIPLIYNRKPGDEKRMLKKTKTNNG